MLKQYLEVKQIYQKLLTSKSLSKFKKKSLYSIYIKKIRQLAYRNLGQAQFDLALHYEQINYFGLNANYKPKKVFYWVKKACINGDADACNNLGTYYEGGFGCKKDINKAISAYKKAIKLGSQSAIKNLKQIKKRTLLA